MAQLMAEFLLSCAVDVLAALLPTRKHRKDEADRPQQDPAS
jgi:hypothetical protein